MVMVSQVIELLIYWSMNCTNRIILKTRWLDMRLLVIATDYPDNTGNVSSMYIHNRNKYYVEHGVDVTVINFKAKTTYMIDGIKVINADAFSIEDQKYDILVSHAPNLRNHYMFLMKYDKCFDNIVFFYHGHEILKVSDVYPKPYQYMKSSSKVSKLIQDNYDTLKLRIWKYYLLKKLDKISFVFVSNWMYEMFLRYVKIDSKIIEEKKNIIYNSIAKKFESGNYNYIDEKDYDFITIRSNLDGSKYCIDVVTKIASLNPNYKFCVIGKGNYYKHNIKPDNMTWIDKTLNHDEIIELLNKSKYALLPTRTDAQGVMACEIATFGIPLITSNIDVCKEVFNEFDNVQYIDNEETSIDIRKIINKIDYTSNVKNHKYFSENTIGKEIELFKRILGNN